MKNKNSLADIDLLFHAEKQIIDLYSFFHSNSLFSKMADQFDFNFSLSFLSSFCLAIFQNVLTSFLTRIPNGRTPTDLRIKHCLNNRLSRIKSIIGEKQRADFLSKPNFFVIAQVKHCVSAVSYLLELLIIGWRLHASLAALEEQSELNKSFFKNLNDVLTACLFLLVLV